MEKVLLFNVDVFRAGSIKSLLGSIGIEAVTINSHLQGCRIGDLLIGKGSDKKSSNGFKESLMLLYDVDDKKLDLALYLLKDKGLKIDFKAVVTGYNINWTVERLMKELKKEREEVLNG